MKLKSCTTRIAAALLALTGTSHAFTLDLLPATPPTSAVIRIPGYGNIYLPIEPADSTSPKTTSAPTHNNNHPFVLITLIAAASKNLNFAVARR